MKQLKKKVIKYLPLTKKVMATSAVMCVLGWGMYFGANYFPKSVVAQVSVPVIIEATTTPPVLVRIEACESGGMHKKNGQVIIKPNTNGTVDTGIMQINSVWNAQASKLGYDLTKEADNLAFGKWLFENKGTSPWSSSAKCWSK